MFYYLKQIFFTKSFPFNLIKKGRSKSKQNAGVGTQASEVKTPTFTVKTVYGPQPRPEETKTHVKKTLNELQKEFINCSAVGVFMNGF